VSPSSDHTTIPVVMKLVEVIQPRSILDVGAGNGQYGFLFRQKLDMDFGRLSEIEWDTQIDCIEIEGDYLSVIHDYVYDTIYKAGWMNHDIQQKYDLIFMGDVLEHIEKWREALDKAISNSRYTIVVCPNWAGSIAQEAWHGYESEIHKTVLSPSLVGGRCIFANSKCFVCVFDNIGSGVVDDRDIFK
jgi:hypothetical protein